MEFQCLWHVVITWQRSNAEYFKIKSVSLCITLRKCVNKMLSALCLLTSCMDFRLLWIVACPSNQQMSFFGTIGSVVRLLGGFFLVYKEEKENLIVTEVSNLVLMEQRWSSEGFFLMNWLWEEGKPWRLSCFAHLISNRTGCPEWQEWLIGSCFSPTKGNKLLEHLFKLSNVTSWGFLLSSL